VRRGPLAALAALVLVVFVVYALAASALKAPHAFADELLYLEAATSLADGDGLSVHGTSYAYGPLYPIAVSVVVRLTPDVEAAWIAARVLNALFVALVAVPVFLLARRLLDPWPAVAVAGLAVAIPSSKYAALVMTESLAYLAAAWAFLAIARAIERPSWRSQVVALAAVALAVGVRTQFLALFVAYVLAVASAALLVPGRLDGARLVLRRYTPTLASLLVGATVLIVTPVVRGDTPGVFGGYASVWRSYDVLDMRRWLVYHLANLELYLAVVPLAVAPIVLVSLYRRARAGDEREAAFLALFVSVNAVLLGVVSAFNSTIYSGERLHDRPLFYVVPLWILLLFVWLRDGLPRPFTAAAIGAAVALVLPLALPVPDYVADEVGLHHNAAATPFWTEVAQGLASVGLSALVAFAVIPLLIVLLALLVPVRLGYVFPLILLVFLGLASTAAWAETERTASDWAASERAAPRRWVDEHVPDGGRVTLLTAIGPCSGSDATHTRYLVEFFNRKVVEVVHLRQQPEQLPDERGAVAADGTVLVARGPLRAAYVVAPEVLGVRGRRLADETTVPVVLTRVDSPVRVDPAAWRRALEQRCG
jgi:hypothetical protein